MKLEIKNVQIDNLSIYGDCNESLFFRKENDFIQIDKEPKELEKLKKEIKSPEQLDSLTKKFGIPANLINYHLATPADLSFLNVDGINKSIHLPVMISSREGGRESLYKLKKGETVLAGIFVNNNGILLRYMKRETGESEFAQDGDKYKYSLKDLKGNLIYQGIGKLEIIDKKIGKGMMEFTQTNSNQIAVNAAMAPKSIWVIFSCIYIEMESKVAQISKS